MNKSYPELYQKAYETLIKIDDLFVEMPDLDNPEIDQQMDKMDDEIYRLLKIVKDNLKEYDMEKLAKWVLSNK